MGAQAKATELAQEFIVEPRKPRTLTQAEIDNEAKWKAIREEWAREDTEEAKRRFPRRA
jgi:hypothetical protein